MHERGQKKGEDANKGAGGNITDPPRQESPNPGGRTKRGEGKNNTATKPMQGRKRQKRRPNHR